jgi:hypothetical protein
MLTAGYPGLEPTSRKARGGLFSRIPYDWQRRTWQRIRSRVWSPGESGGVRAEGVRLRLHDQLRPAVPTQAEALAGLLRLDVEGEPLDRADANSGTWLNGDVRVGLPGLALNPDLAPRCASLDHDRSEPKDRVHSDQRRSPPRPPKAIDDGNDLPSDRRREADTVPRMGEQQKKHNPNQQRKHRLPCTRRRPPQASPGYAPRCLALRVSSLKAAYSCRAGSLSRRCPGAKQGGSVLTSVVVVSAESPWRSAPPLSAENGQPPTSP